MLFRSERLEPGTGHNGIRVVDLAPILKYDAEPLASTIVQVLDIFKQSMGIPVEIEWAFDFSNGSPFFYLLQIKPLMQNSSAKRAVPDQMDPEELLIQSGKCMGNGYIDTITDIVYLDPETFDKSKTEVIAKELEEINTRMKEENRSYILFGYGRWGTRDQDIRYTKPEEHSSELQ